VHKESNSMYLSQTCLGGNPFPSPHSIVQGFRGQWRLVSLYAVSICLAAQSGVA